MSVYIYACLHRICFQSIDKHHHGHILQETDGNHYLFDSDYLYKKAGHFSFFFNNYSEGNFVEPFNCSILISKMFVK